MIKTRKKQIFKAVKFELLKTQNFKAALYNNSESCIRAHYITYVIGTELLLY